MQSEHWKTTKSVQVMFTEKRKDMSVQTEVERCRK